MSSIPQQPGSLALINPITYDLEGSQAAATHFSHGGVGGFVELPTLLYRNTIPTHPEGAMHEGGLSSGRRKLGMIVFVQETNKFYQLIPRNPDGSIINITDWEAKSNYQKVVLLDPARDAVYDGENDVFYSGSGNADEAWTEVFVKGNFSNISDLNLYATGNAAAYAGQICSTLDTNSVYVLDSGLSPLAIGGGGGDDLLNNNLTVLGVSIGSYSDGQTITKDTSLETIIKNMLQKRIPPAYFQPAFSISTDITSSHEIGTSISPKIMGSWTQNNAGALKEYIIYKGSSLVSGPSSDLPLTHFTDSSFVLSSVTSYSATAEWFDGDVLDDNMGDPNLGVCPNCRVVNNASNPKVSNVITFTPKRAVFYTADTATSAPTMSSQIRGFTPRIDIGNGSTFTVTVGTTAKRVVIAYLKSYGAITSVIDSGNGYRIEGAFGIPAEISVLGANGFTGETYYVYTYLLGNSYPSPVTYTVTI